MLKTKLNLNSCCVTKKKDFCNRSAILFSYLIKPSVKWQINKASFILMRIKENFSPTWRAEEKSRFNLFQQQKKKTSVIVVWFGNREWYCEWLWRSQVPFRKWGWPIWHLRFSSTTFWMKNHPGYCQLLQVSPSPVGWRSWAWPCSLSGWSTPV